MKMDEIIFYRFRQGFKRFFRCCPFVEVKQEMLSRREAVTSRYSCSGSPDHRIVRNGMKCMESHKMQFPVRDFIFYFILNPMPQIRSVLFSTHVQVLQRVIGNRTVRRVI